MADDPKKSKLPDLNEAMGMAGKFVKDLTSSVKGIVADYQNKREEGEAASSTEEEKHTPEAPPVTPPVAPPIVKPTSSTEETPTETTDKTDSSENETPKE